LAAPEARFSCEECVFEMHNLERLIKAGAHDIREYLIANYCPTLDEEIGHHIQCEEDLTKYYIGMLDMVVRHWFVDGAVHVCMTMGICRPWERKFTCDECIEGLEWVQAYMLDPIVVAEMTIYLEQQGCIDEWEGCKEVVAEHFPPMHLMAMEKFMIPTEICNQEPPCTGDWPTKPPQK
jgi:hypothetical protein